MGFIWDGMGFSRFPLVLCSVLVVLFGLWSALKLYRPGASPEIRTKVWTDAVLFWGGMAMLVGILGFVTGVIIVLQGYEAGSPTTMATGAKAALLSSGSGTMILIFAALLWFFLQLRWRLLAARIANADT
jgi:hypothetical protein